tara:strand:- start:9404 stop:10681 length:1278 start_codon:yes stop_codon:yes gene_type:complete
MSQLNPTLNAAQADQLYFDITVSNFKSTTVKPPEFYFNEQRTMPFVSNPQDYYLSILRFTMETGSLPVFIPSIEPNQADLNKTLYSLRIDWETDAGLGAGIETKATSGEKFVSFIPQDGSVSIPLPPNQTDNGLQNNSTGYYNVYNYGWFIDLINITLGEAYADLAVAITAATTPGPSPYGPAPGNGATDAAPFLNWDTTSNSAVAYFDFSAFGTNNGTSGPVGRFKLYFNAPLFALFPTFPAKYKGYAPALVGRNFLFEPRNNGSSDLDTITVAPVPPAPAPPTYRAVKVYQDCSTIANMSPITAVVFVSNTLPIQSNQVSTPLIFNNSQEVVLGGNNSNFANIITDLVSDTGQYKPNLVYNPSSQYRLITLYGNTPISNIDLRVFWRNKFGQLNPFIINSGEAITMKVAFLKKSAYNNKNFNP